MTIREAREKLEETICSPYAALAKHSRGRNAPCRPCPVRTCFQRDIDRIVHSKSFRRLRHKTQVFLQPEGDHYRTRMTHTMEVVRIARTIARGLSLNEDLAEAIAFGHDLGHTPFGHAGEEALNSIMPEGFQHNVQSLRVADKLEHGGAGLNLTLEVRQGILCHTGREFADTLEGRMIRFADQIAYINHDIDDAVRGGIIVCSQVPEQARRLLGETGSDRIGALVIDIIEESRGRPEMRQSAALERGMQTLRDYLFEAVYRNPVAKGEETKAKDMLRFLFEYYRRDPERLPAQFQEIGEREGRDRAVCDYIAGMTDKYVIEKYADAFIPKSWAVK